ncbi:MAG TPA: hypothetical protein VIO61_06790 [Anaerolineaceae bacterium]
MHPILENGARFIWASARLLEQKVFAYHFCGAAGDEVIAALAAYQNADGGLGHALEADVRAPASQPLFAEFGLKLLYDHRLRAPALTARVCDFLATISDLQRGLPALLPSAFGYPLAGHWKQPGADAFSMSRLAAVVGPACWQGIEHPWLEQAARVCADFLRNQPLRDAHLIQNAFCLAESRPEPGLFEKLADDLSRADFFIHSLPITGYGLNPLHFAPAPQSYCRRLFSQEQVDGFLDDLISRQAPDGGWGISWEPPDGAALLEWRGYTTVNALVTLRAYSRI